MAAAAKRVLIVDDNRTVRLKLREELEEGGYQVLEATNGLEAICVAASASQLDLITLDIEMPKMSGFETCQKLRNPDYSRFISPDNDEQIPIIFITGNDNIKDRRKGFRLGAVDFIAKPFEKGEILAAVDKILNNKVLDREIVALVADDSKVARKIAVGCLSREGIKVLEAEDGAKAYEIIASQRERVDIVLSDLMMPAMDGKTLCRRIRKDLLMVDIPVIFLTGITDLSELIELFRVGATDYLVKPFAKEELLARVLVHVERNRIQRQLRDTIEQLKRANETIKQLSIIDPLTGCYNRGYLNEHINPEIKRSIRYESPISIIICDIDHFKKVNDTFGHQCGDEVLIEFVRIIQNTIRKDLDWVARYGGEEFVIVLPETSTQNAKVLAERLRVTIEKTSIKSLNKTISITASFGIAGLDDLSLMENLSPDQLLSIADENLYKAKQEGRNRVVC